MIANEDGFGGGRGSRGDENILELDSDNGGATLGKTLNCTL